MKSFKTLVEASYEELRDLGAKKEVVKSDGKRATQYSMNYMIGYYEARIKEAQDRGDKFEVKLYKDALADVKAKSIKVNPKITDYREK